jgi:protein-L-isoaspartate(D-aspartate) O-methyltransferase
MMNFEQVRFNFQHQLRTLGVLDEQVLELISKVKREDFVPHKYLELAFSEVEIPLPGGQKMLCPQLEGQLIQQLNLKRHDKVLEIGAGSGYVTALLAKKVEQVYAIECNEENFSFASHNLEKVGFRNIQLILGNGLMGLVSRAPFDKIFVGGGVIEIPLNLKSQLKIGGILVAIVGKLPLMRATVIKRISDKQYEQKILFETVVPYLEGSIVPKFKF